MKKLKRIFTILYIIFLVNGGLGLFVTRYRLIAEIPLVVLIVMQCQHRFKNFISHSELKYILIRLGLIAGIGLRFVKDVELLLGNRIIGAIIVVASIVVIYKKWLLSDIDRIKKIPHVRYLYGAFGIIAGMNLFNINIGIINIAGVGLLLLFMLETARDNKIEKIKRQIAWVLFCGCSIISLIGIVGSGI